MALALLLASSTLTGCDLFRPRQEEASNQEIELEAPEPDEDNLGADLMDDSEVEADVDPDIEDTEQTEEVVEEPETTDSSATTENKDTASASSSQKDRSGRLRKWLQTYCLVPWSFAAVLQKDFPQQDDHDAAAVPLAGNGSLGRKHLLPCRTVRSLDR